MTHVKALKEHEPNLHGTALLKRAAQALKHQMERNCETLYSKPGTSVQC
jgi:hypothetical protein